MQNKSIPEIAAVVIAAIVITLFLCLFDASSRMKHINLKVTYVDLKVIESKGVFTL
jgi:hypothetical protein